MANIKNKLISSRLLVPIISLIAFVISSLIILMLDNKISVNAEIYSSPLGSNFIYIENVDNLAYCYFNVPREKEYDQYPGEYYWADTYNFIIRDMNTNTIYKTISHDDTNDFKYSQGLGYYVILNDVINHSGHYNVYAFAYWSHDGYTLTTDTKYFSFIINESDGSNDIVFELSQYAVPIISHSNYVLSFVHGSTYGDNYEICVGDYSKKTIEKSMVKSWEEKNISLFDEFFTTLNLNKTYDVWIVSLRKGLYDTSEPSNNIPIYITDNIPIKMTNSIVSFNAVTSFNDYDILVGDTKTRVSGFLTISFDLGSLDLPTGTFLLKVIPYKENLIVITQDNELHIGIANLDAPRVVLENDTIKWDSVKYANGYRIYYSNTYVETTNTSYKLRDLGLDYGQHTVRVTAIGNISTKSLINYANASRVYSQMVCINYDVDGDLTQILVPYGSTITPPNVQLDDLILEGWYYDKAFTNKVAEGDTATSNMTIYARLVESEITQTFWSKYGTIMTTIIIVVCILLVIGVGFPMYKKMRGKL